MFGFVEHGLQPSRLDLIERAISEVIFAPALSYRDGVLYEGRRAL
ncbi:hypothetical protein [Sorangium sp. So ce1182]